MSGKPRGWRGERRPTDVTEDPRMEDRHPHGWGRQPVPGRGGRTGYAVVPWRQRSAAVASAVVPGGAQLRTAELANAARRQWQWAERTPCGALSSLVWAGIPCPQRPRCPRAPPPAEDEKRRQKTVRTLRTGGALGAMEQTGNGDRESIPVPTPAEEGSPRPTSRLQRTWYPRPLSRSVRPRLETPRRPHLPGGTADGVAGECRPPG